MRQALHIFKKDVRQFWYQILLVLAVTTMFAYADIVPWASVPNHVPLFAMNAKPLISPDVDSFAGIGAFTSFDDGSMLSELIVLAWCCLIALVIHAEPIPGDRQFWLTRPYDRRSLWGAKTLFVLTFVNLPMLVVQATVIAKDGFPVASNLSGLVWEQVLIVTLIALPAMAIATVTRTMTQFVFLLFLAASAVSGFAILLMIPFLPFFSPWYLEGHRMGALSWLQDFVGTAAMGATAFGILFLQFMRRRTWTSRVLAVTGATVGLTAFWFVPWSPIFAVQSHLSRHFDGSLRAEISRPQPSNLPRYGTTDTLDLPIRIAGLPAGTLLACEAAAIRVESASGSTWHSGVIRFNPDELPIGSRISQAPDGCRVRAIVANAFFNSNREQQVRIQGALYVTVFGDEHSMSMRPSAEPVNVPGVGLCRATLSEEGVPAMLCRAAFRWPPRLVWVRDDTGRGEVFAETMSYSPFPAELNISPVESYWARASLNQSGDATIVTQEPIAHVRTDVELRDVRLGDLEFGNR
jgi:hypothetical protein